MSPISLKDEEVEDAPTVTKKYQQRYSNQEYNITTQYAWSQHMLRSMPVRSAFTECSAKARWLEGIQLSHWPS